MKKQPLWFWGAMCIFAGCFAGLLPELAGARPKTRPEMLGQGAATLLFVITGIVLVILHFVRGNRDGDKDADEAEAKRPMKPGRGKKARKGQANDP